MGEQVSRRGGFCCSGQQITDNHECCCFNQIRSYYADLKNLSQEYWKKYTNRNDMNAYVRLFSIFDFSMFNEIEKLLPGRTDKVLGLVVEPNILERSKQPWKPVKVERKDPDATIRPVEKELNGDHLQTEAEVVMPTNEIEGTDILAPEQLEDIEQTLDLTYERFDEQRQTTIVFKPNHQYNISLLEETGATLTPEQLQRRQKWLSTKK